MTIKNPPKFVYKKCEKIYFYNKRGGFIIMNVYLQLGIKCAVYFLIPIILIAIFTEYSDKKYENANFKFKDED